MRAVPLCGQKVVARLETIGITCLADLQGQDPIEVLERVNIAAGRPIWHPPIAVRALENLIDAAEHEGAVA